MEMGKLFILGMVLLLLLGCAGRGGINGDVPTGEPTGSQGGSGVPEEEPEDSGIPYEDEEGVCGEESPKECIVEPKEMRYGYLVHGDVEEIEFTVYGGLNEYLGGLERDPRCSPICPTDTIIQLGLIENEVQDEQLLLLLEQIKEENANADVQARIAMSLVQEMPYDWASVVPGQLKNRYPYEVLYDYTGVCGEKSRLLAFLLKEMGYGVALIEFSNPHHMGVGIKCPEEYNYRDSGYCFVETTVPSIITYSEWRFINSEGQVAVHVISEGKELGGVEEEYMDAGELKGLIENYKMRTNLNYGEYNRFLALMEKYGMNLEN